MAGAVESPDTWRRRVITAVSILSILFVWQAATELGALDPRYVSSPLAIIEGAGDLFAVQDMWRHTKLSLYEFASGFALAMTVGIPGGFALGWYKRPRRYLEAILMALYSTPRVALIPVLIVWLGIGAASKIAIVFLGAVFPIMVNAMAGVVETDRSLIRAARAFCGKRRDIFSKIILPSSVPSVIAGMQLGVGRAIVGIVVAEMFAASAGVGYLIRLYGSAFRVDYLMLLVLLISAFGYVANTLLDVIARFAQRWKTA